MKKWKNRTCLQIAETFGEQQTQARHLWNMSKTKKQNEISNHATNWKVRRVFCKAQHKKAPPPLKQSCAENAQSEQANNHTFTFQNRFQFHAIFSVRHRTIFLLRVSIDSAPSVLQCARRRHAQTWAQLCDAFQTHVSNIGWARQRRDCTLQKTCPIWCLEGFIIKVLIFDFLISEIFFKFPTKWFLFDAPWWHVCNAITNSSHAECVLGS